MFPGVEGGGDGDEEGECGEAEEDEADEGACFEFRVLVFVLDLFQAVPFDWIVLFLSHALVGSMIRNGRAWQPAT